MDWPVLQEKLISDLKRSVVTVVAVTFGR